ncbi:MAG: hypothetical protein RIQ60_1397 [Pseudomonadota bacterium]|jgi:cation diffusion facilitator family transporter
MHTHDLAEWQHDHQFDTGNAAGERGTLLVTWITAGMMAIEIAAGWFYNSMALLADGLHMSSHTVAIGLSAFAYAAARRHARDPRYAFGTWKIEVLAGYTSAIFLLVVVALMLYGAIDRLIRPEPIHYQQALVIAVIGLIVNLVSAYILGAAHHPEHSHPHAPHDPAHAGQHRDHDHDHDHEHGHDHGHHPHHDHHHHDDLNLKSAYLHVIADAATSVAAIAALAGGWWLGWSWLDPVMGILGAIVVVVWAKGLVADTSKVLLDREMDHPVVGEIRALIADRGADGTTMISDLHVWRVGKAGYSCALSLVTHDAHLTPQQVRAWLAVHEDIVHTTIEIQRHPASPG